MNVSAGSNQSVNEGSSVTLTGSFVDPSGSTTSIDDWHVVASSGQQIADGTGPTFTFTPGNAGTYTVTHGHRPQRRLGLGRRGDHLRRRPAGPDRPQHLAEHVYAGVSTSINLGTLALTGIGPFTDNGPVGRRPDLDLLTHGLRAALPGSHVCDGGDLHDRRDRLRVRRWLRRPPAVAISVTHRRHVDHAHVVDGLRGLRPVGDLYGHRDRPGGPDGHRGVLRRPGHTGRSDRHRHADRGERPVPGDVQHARSRPAAVRTQSRRSTAAMRPTRAAHRTSSARRSPRPAR